MPRTLESLDLFAPEAVSTPHAERRPVPRKPQLWVAVSLPNLPLECLPAVLPEPAVVVEAERGQLQASRGERN